MASAQKEFEQGRLPQFTLNEAAFLANALWRVTHGPNGLPLWRIVATLSADGREGSISDYEGYWGVDRAQLLEKVGPLTEEHQNAIRALDGYFDKLPDNVQLELYRILKNWLNTKEDRKDRLFFHEQLKGAGLSIVE